jgi:hypothetical protein
MTPNPSAQNSSLPNTSSDSSSNIPSSFPTAHAYPLPHSDDSALPSPSTSRFNSFALPPYRNPHSGTSDVPVPSSSSLSSSFAHTPFSQLPNPSVAEPTPRHLSTSSTASNYHPPQQQLPSSQLLPSTSTTPSSSSFVGSAAKTAGGGGGSGSAGSGVPNLSLGQIHLLIATINDRNYETKRKEIQRVSRSPVLAGSGVAR